MLAVIFLFFPDDMMPRRSMPSHTMNQPRYMQTVSSLDMEQELGLRDVLF